MPFSIIRNDITQVHADAIVNSANPKPIIGAGTDARIHRAAGPALLEARKQIGSIAPGRAAVTAAFDLPARYVIHTVGPVWDGGSYGEESLLRSCYDHCLRLARDRGCQSIAFPLIAAGNYGFPKDKALQIAIAAFSAFLMEADMQIYLVVYEKSAYRLSEKLFQTVASYIDDHYVQLQKQAPSCAAARPLSRRRRDDLALCKAEAAMDACAAPMAQPASLQDYLQQADEGFTETLLRLIDQTGKKDADIYRKANVSRQHFSKIRNNPQYRPTKATALAFAIALELDLEQTKDLIGRAGYALTNSSKADLIIRYFIEQRNYDLMQINTTLFEFDQSLLGG